MAMRLCIIAMLALAATTQAAKVTPMEKVMGLLKDLSAKVAAEGKKEAANYDKYACFCKEQADNKLYAIEKSTVLIAMLKAEIDDLEGEINQLNFDIKELTKTIRDKKNKISSKTKTRDSEHEKFLKDKADYDGAIEACEGAIAALKDSKGALSADAKASLSLVQVRTAKLNIQGAPKYQYQSNDIISTLEELLTKTKASLSALVDHEFELKAIFDSKTIALANEQKFAEAEKAEKEATLAAKSDKQAETKDEKSREDDDKEADEAFLKVVTGKCEDAAKAFDQRSTARAAELTALTEAEAELSKGAAVEGAIKKLVGFLQIRRVRKHSTAHSQQAAIQQAQVLLSDAADRTSSGVLSSIALRVKVSEDHFVKVRTMIKDLISKLKDDAKDEADQKSMCDKQMSKAINKRDKANGDLETATAQLSILTSKKAQLEEEIQDAMDAVAANTKALNEATTLRKEEKDENDDTIKDATAGKEAVDNAIKILSKFYDNAFMQKSKKYVPPNSDRDGNTVADLAPEFDTSKYSGAQSESKGIIGIMEVILEDFTRTIAKTGEDDGLSQDAFDEFEKDTNLDTEKKEKKIKLAEAELKKTESSLVDETGNEKDATEMLDNAKAALAKLKPMCVEGEETWAERAAKRKEEIEALKNAMTILNEWQS